MKKTIVGVKNNITPERSDAFIRSVNAVGCEPRLAESINEALPFLNWKGENTVIIAIDFEELISFSDANIYDVLNTIRTMCCMNKKPVPAVMVYSDGNIDPKCIREMLKAGVKGITFANDNFTADDRIEAWTEIMAGRTYLHKDVQGALKPVKKNRKADEDDIKLTPRLELGSRWAT